MNKQLINLFQNNPGRFYRQRELIKILKIKPGAKANFLKELDSLKKSGVIKQVKGQRYTLSKESNTVEGTLSVAQKGFGFVIVGKDQPDIFIGRRQLGDAINGDIVRVQLARKDSPAGPRGRIVKVIERKSDYFIGVTYKEQNQYWLSLSPVTPARGIRLLPRKPIKFKTDHVVKAVVKDWGTAFTPILAEVEEIIGSSEDPANDVKMIIAKYDYHLDFPQAVRSELKTLNEGLIKREIPNRKDLRRWITMTIDPEDARDFDDALSIREIGQGFLLGVHIADVTHFVSAGSRLDREALNRGTSVYFTEGVVSMLPEILSADLCSLKPDQDRLAVSCLIKLNRDFEVQRVEVLPTVIRSSQRFNYRQVQAILDGRKDHRLKKELKLLERLSRVLFSRRSAEGSIDFDIPEPNFALTAEGIPHEIRPSERLQSHRLVEECMLLANRLVAEQIPSLLPKRYPFIYRIHDKPEKADILRFIELINRLPLDIFLSEDGFTTGKIKTVLTRVADSPYKHLIETVALRTMTKAAYSHKNRGHFGLAFKSYTHFTSPIRRYPDLMVHRIIKLAHRGTFLPRKEWDEWMDRGIKQANEMELVALRAEREYIKIKQLRWLSTQVGNVFNGIISGVINIGLFVELKESLAEGLIHIDSLDDDTYSYNEDNYCLRGNRLHREFQLGDPVKVRVLSVLFEKQRANFVLEN